jgi:hypothetical protein
MVLRNLRLFGRRFPAIFAFYFEAFVPGTSGDTRKFDAFVVDIGEGIGTFLPLLLFKHLEGRQ